MTIRLDNYSNVSKTEFFNIQIVGTNDCGFDVITFGQRFEAESYTFSKPINEVVFDPQIQQSVANCPRTCSFYENGETINLPNLFISNLDYGNGVVRFASDASYLDGSVLAVTVVCESTESTMPPPLRIAYDRFTVNFEIDCESDIIEFVSDFETIDYFVDGNSQPQFVMPIFTQTHPSCPVSCQVASPVFQY